jgi:hypothetical protein
VVEDCVQFGKETGMGKSSETMDEKVRRFENAVRELIEEGHSLFDYRGLLEKAAERAGVDLQEVHPTRH